MALQFYHGTQIGGGGTTILPMTQAEYLANKAVLDASDFLIDITDESDQLAYADEIGYSIDSTNKSVKYIGDITTKSLGKVEYQANNIALYAHTVGEYFINKNGEYCKCINAVSIGQTLTENTNYVVTNVGSEIKEINAQLSAKIPNPTTFKQGTFDISVTANTLKSISSVADIKSGTLPTNFLYTLFQIGGFSDALPTKVSQFVDGNALKIMMDVTNSNVAVQWLSFK